MKKILAVLLVCVLALAAVSCGKSENSDGVQGGKYESDKLKVFLPGAYIAENIVPDFEKKFGVEVIVENFDSNEMMYTKLAAGDTYDVLIPSDYMIERLIKEDYIQPIDKSKVPNMAKLSDQVKGLGFDPELKYSVPYFWGNVGIVYNKNVVSEDDLKNEGFDIFRDTKYKGKLYMYDSERDAFMIAFKQLGYSCNTENDDEINAAYDWLVDISKNMSPVYVTDECIDGMANGSKDLCLMYSGDAAYVLSENEEMGYYVPECGTNIWCDAMVIPKSSKNTSLAYEFINYILSDDVCRDNTAEVGYTTPNKNIFDEVTAPDGDFDGNDAYIPRTGYAKDETFNDNEYLRQRLTELLIKVKAAK